MPQASRKPNPTPLTEGDRVVVYQSRSLVGVPESEDVVEGEATLKKAIKFGLQADGYEFWEVTFPEDPGEVFPRWVHSDDLVPK